MAERQFHIQCTAEDIGHYVFLPGDPDRVPWIASYLENAQKVAQSREFTTYTGTLDGTRVSVTSTGIGGPSAAIAMEELVALGAHTFLRIGTCGGMQPELGAGGVDHSHRSDPHGGHFAGIHAAGISGGAGFRIDGTSGLCGTCCCI